MILFLYGLFVVILGALAVNVIITRRFYYATFSGEVGCVRPVKRVIRINILSTLVIYCLAVPYFVVVGSGLMGWTVLAVALAFHECAYVLKGKIDDYHQSIANKILGYE